MKRVSSSIVVVSDWGFSCIKESTRVLKKDQSGFFNFHLFEEGGGNVLVDKSVIRMGRWSLSYISFRIYQDILWASDTLERDMSILEKWLFDGLILVGSPLLSNVIESLAMIFSIYFPRASVLFEPQYLLRLLKSPSKINGLGSNLMTLSISDVLKVVWFGMYMLHVEIFDSRVIWTAMTSKLE